MNETKICSKCKIEQPIKNFAKDNLTKTRPSDDCHRKEILVCLLYKNKIWNGVIVASVFEKDLENVNKFAQEKL